MSVSETEQDIVSQSDRGNALRVRIARKCPEASYGFGLQIQFLSYSGKYLWDKNFVIGLAYACHFNIMHITVCI